MSTYTRFTTDDIVPSNQTIVTTGLWSGDTGSLEGNALFLYDTQLGKSGEYYFDAYDVNPNSGGSDLAEVQFAVSYGHINGGGAPSLSDDETSKLPTKAIYSQYRNLCLGPTDTKFVFEGVESDHIYVINMQRARVREQLDPGNWQLPLSGANGVLTFIDDSDETLEALTQTTTAGRVFSVVSGSISSVSGSVTSSTNARTFNGKGYGLVYPDLGVIILNPDAICPAVGFYVSGSIGGTSGDLLVTGSAVTGSSLITSGAIYTSTNITALDSQTCVPFAPLTASIADTAWNGQKAAFNQSGLFSSIKNAIATQQYEFKARSAETISSTHYFVRLRSAEYNYSNNSTFRNPDDNTIIIPSFKSDPRVYLTTVGLYNDNNELLAVAKLSKPLRKSFTEEVLLRVRLDF